jgi:hypothetical protein
MEKHTRFIGVLERVLEMLEPNAAPQTTGLAQEDVQMESIGRKTEVESDKLANLFDVLA